MANIIEISRTAQQFICMTLAALVVIGSLSLGAYGAEYATHLDYSVTITQL